MVKRAARNPVSTEFRGLVAQLSIRELDALIYLARLYIRRRAEPNVETSCELARMQQGFRDHSDGEAPLPFVPVTAIRH